MSGADSALLAELTNALRARGIPEPSAEAEAILAAAREQPGDAAARARELAARRAEGAPLGYVCGRARFLGLTLLVAPGVIAPREETELLGRTGLSLLEKSVPAGAEALAIDMCCGAGNLACALAHHRPGLRVWASDLTADCAALATRNAEQLGLTNRVTVMRGDLFAPLAGQGLEGRVDLVVCNPPYISTGRLEKDRAELLRHEPREAFDGGPYGLSIHQRVLKDAPTFLRSGGWLAFEFGAGQERQLELLFKRAGTYDSFTLAHDSAGTPRAAFARRT